MPPSARALPGPTGESNRLSHFARGPILCLGPGALAERQANAIRALNKGAKLGGFYHDTGEGSISRYHRAHGPVGRRPAPAWEVREVAEQQQLLERLPALRARFAGTPGPRS